MNWPIQTWKVGVKKWYQDIAELLNAGIDVYTTVNVQHMEGLNEVIENITKSRVQETVPDYIFERADKIKLIDIEPDELLRRFEAEKYIAPNVRNRLCAISFHIRLCGCCAKLLCAARQIKLPGCGKGAAMVTAMFLRSNLP